MNTLGGQPATMPPVLILAAHGFGDGSRANRLVNLLARRLQRRRRDVRVVAVFNMGTPGIADLVGVVQGREVGVLPLMLSDGYFSGEHLRSQFNGAGISLQAVRFARAVGTGQEVQAQGIVAVRNAAAMVKDQASVGVIVVGHGTCRSATSGATTHALAEALRTALPRAFVQPAFLDQDPLLEDVAKGALAKHTIVLPFLVGGGDHASVDVPERLCIAQERADATGWRTRIDGLRFHILRPIGEQPGIETIVEHAAARLLPRPVIRLGTRSSALALRQADLAAVALRSVGADVRVVTIDTAGDQDQTRPIESFATDGPFTDALESALLAGEIDAAMHSVKDLPSEPARGTTLAAYLPRGDAGEALVSRDGLTLADLPLGAVVGTCSARRAAQILRLRPDAQIVPLRGTVEARLRQVGRGLDAAVLAVAGLERLGLSDSINHWFRPAEMLPEAGQGAIVVQTRDDGGIAEHIVRHMDHRTTRRQVDAERRLVALMSSETSVVIGAWAAGADLLTLRARAITADGRLCADVCVHGGAPDDVAQSAREQLVVQLQAAFAGGIA